MATLASTGSQNTFHEEYTTDFFPSGYWGFRKKNCYCGSKGVEGCDNITVREPRKVKNRPPRTDEETDKRAR